jgi:hypothetical protein
MPAKYKLGVVGRDMAAFLNIRNLPGHLPEFKKEAQYRGKTIV